LAFILFDEEIRKSAALIWFGLQDVGILYSRAVIQGTIDVSSAILEHGWAEKIAAKYMQTVICMKRLRTSN
jgi:hypothetical protein